MGAFYGSILVRTDNTDVVKLALEDVAQETDCKFQLGPVINGWASVFPNNGGQSDQIPAEIARRLPYDIFHLIVHDDDIFGYYFYRDGRLMDEYNSCPDYFGEVPEEEMEESRGNPELFKNLLRDPKSLAKLKSLLAADNGRFTFESERMSQFVELLGLSNAMSSYEYLQGGERDEIEGWEQFIHIEKKHDPAEEFNKSGDAKRDKGDLDGALVDLSNAIEINPNLAEAHHNRGRVKRLKGDLTGALVDFDKAIELNPNHSTAYSNRSLVKMAKGNWDGALADCNKAIELNPNLASAYNNRAEVKRTKGQFDSALVDYDRAVELKPDSDQIYNNRGEGKRAKGDLDGAMADFNKALELNPSSVAALNNRGIVKREKGDLVGAMADCDKALHLKPDLAATFNNRGLVKQVKGDLDGALADLDKAIELKPGVTHFHKNRGDVRRIKGDLAGALADYDRTLELKPDWAEVYNNRGFLKKTQGNLGVALVDFDKAIQLKPDLIATYSNRGELKKLIGDLDGSLTDYNRSIELKPDWAVAYNNRGEVKRLKGDFDGALADYDHALQLKPDLAAAQKNRDLVLKSKLKTGTDNKQIPVTENSLALRTDFSDEAAWKALCKTIQEPDNEFGFEANVDFVNDSKFDGVTAEQLLALLSDDSALSFAFIIDHIALTQPDHPILVIDLQDEPGRTFRVVVSALWEVENNLSIANMDFEDFINTLDKNGIYRGSV
jgi:tetratricopeptide (TPR) repeat protein